MPDLKMISGRSQVTPKGCLAHALVFCFCQCTCLVWGQWGGQVTPRGCLALAFAFSLFNVIFGNLCGVAVLGYECECLAWDQWEEPSNPKGLLGTCPCLLLLSMRMFGMGSVGGPSNPKLGTCLCVFITQ